MTSISPQVKEWIEAGRDPRTAHWQAGLESVLEIFQPLLEPGQLTPIQPLAEDEIPVFQEALAAADLSPNLLAAFLPPAVADKIRPPAAAGELQRIERHEPSFKVIIARPGQETRLVCVELSPRANNPGVDIFQSGALLGTYDFGDRAECLEALPRTFRAHIWEKDRWDTAAYRRYTINWWTRVLALENGKVSVAEDCSFFHTPTLIKSNRVEALFRLIADTLGRRAESPDEALAERLAALRDGEMNAARRQQCQELAESMILQLVALVKEYELMDFGSFTDTEARQFQQEFARTVQRISDAIQG